ncbi:hypothetical protein ACJRO7_025774 [Eucalyptus globulus]|uniref:Gnk2-homologous domain-containing protein n=1 Tax=Eucalyptus globulus TaxID=34317 RepID=A0ABD3KA27_EUCGL
MATFQRIIAILTRLLCICNTARGLTNTTVMYSNVQMYVPSTEYGYLVVETLGDLVQETPMWAYGYYNQRPGSEQTVYGHGVCRRKLSQPNCYNCTHLALQTITRQCPNAVGARVQLVACRMSFDYHGAMKNDLKKAYDGLDKDFIRKTLVACKFPGIWIETDHEMHIRFVHYKGQCRRMS